MPEVKQLEFSFKEVAEALIRYSKLKSGLWGVSIRFGLQASNIAASPGDNLVPAAIVPIIKIGLQQFSEQNNLTVDAATIVAEKKT